MQFRGEQCAAWKFATLVGECLGCGEPDAFAATLVAGLRRMTPIEDATVLHYGKGDLPAIVYREVPALSGADSELEMPGMTSTSNPASE